MDGFVEIRATATAAATARGLRQARCPGNQHDSDTAHPSNHFHRSTEAPRAYLPANATGIKVFRG